MTDSPFFYTWTAQRHAQGMTMAAGDGCWFETESGDRWLDFGSMSYQASLGHGHKTMIRAVQDQAARLCVTMPHADYPQKRELAERLLALAPPGFTKVFFTLGGSEANENALKVARMVTGRYKVLSRYRSYHGATMGALSLTGDFRHPPLEPGLVGAMKALDCYCDRCPFGQRLGSCAFECASHIDQILALEKNIGAVFLEAVPGANGVLIPPPSYWPTVREACDRHGALLVADEVLTGFGRTGRCFAFEHFDVAPDLITLGKALTAGYGVLGAVLMHERVASHFDDEVLYAGLTHYAHPLGVAAALAALEVYEREALYERAHFLQRPFREGLERIARRFGPKIRGVRAIGLLGAIELDVGADELERIRSCVADAHLYAHFRTDDRTVILSPPLIVTESEIHEAFGRLERSFERAARESSRGR